MKQAKGGNANHPARGAKIKVEPIKKLKDIKSIKKMLSDKPRDYCLFVLGINTNLRASDLLGIKAEQVRDIKVGSEMVLKETKTGKERRITLNQSAVDAVNKLLSVNEFEDKDWLFEGQRKIKGQREPLTVSSVNRLVKSWCNAINLRGNYGSHSLRKTFGYHQRTQLNTSIPELMVMFNHATQKQTLDYLCIQPEEIKDAYLKLCL